MVRPCGILRRDAIEARGDYLIARGSCRRRFVHSARAGRLLAAGLIESGSARSLCLLVTFGNDRHRFDLRLSSHRATAATTSFSHRVLATLLTISFLVLTSIVTTRRDRGDPVRPTGPQIAS